MTRARCAHCGGTTATGERLDCPVCARPLAICTGCGWCIRLFDEADPADCDGCGHDPHAPAPGRDDAIQAALERQGAAWRQMTQRSGPIYATAKERSKAVADAYRAAGSPAKVYGAHGPAAHLAAPWDREKRIVPATPEQAAAWRAWTAQRERLRRELRGGKPTYVDAATVRETAAGSTVTPEQASAWIEERNHDRS